MADECLFSVNERTAFPLAVTFLDEDSLPVIPTSATYRIDDEGSKTASVMVLAFRWIVLAKYPDKLNVI